MCLKYKSSPEKEMINFSKWEVQEDTPEMMIYEHSSVWKNDQNLKYVSS